MVITKIKITQEEAKMERGKHKKKKPETPTSQNAV
jgi:hypothetical protein